MSKSKKQKQLYVSPVADAIMHALEPVIESLDAGQNFARDHQGSDHGHELPSRKDSMLRVLIGNYCRDTYQQIHGVATEKYTFTGIKDSWDRAQNAVAQLVNRYANNPEDMDADPNSAKFYTWYEQTSAKMEALNNLLVAFQNVYKDITGEEWKYVAPGQSASKTNIPAAEAAAKLRAMMAEKRAS